MNHCDRVYAAKTIYPTLVEYVEFVKRAPKGAHRTGLCTAMNDYTCAHLDSLLDVYRHERHEPVLPCGSELVPFNCTCSDEEHGLPYWKESFTPRRRIDNPYRRAFINWVCRLADQPELLP